MPKRRRTNLDSFSVVEVTAGVRPLDPIASNVIQTSIDLHEALLGRREWDEAGRLRERLTESWESRVHRIIFDVISYSFSFFFLCSNFMYSSTG